MNALPDLAGSAFFGPGGRFPRSTFLIGFAPIGLFMLNSSRGVPGLGWFMLGFFA